MKKCLLILLTAALAIVPTAAFATFSVIQDSCRTDGNNETTYFSVVNFNSPEEVCDLHFIPENPVPGCIVIGCDTPAGWGCSQEPGSGGVDYHAITPGDCLFAGQIKRGFSFTLDPEFCCYIVQFQGHHHQVIDEAEICFSCVHVGVDKQTWGNVKKLYQH